MERLNEFLSNAVHYLQLLPFIQIPTPQFVQGYMINMMLWGMVSILSFLHSFEVPYKGFSNSMVKTSLIGFSLSSAYYVILIGQFYFPPLTIGSITASVFPIIFLTFMNMKGNLGGDKICENA